MKQMVFELYFNPRETNLTDPVEIPSNLNLHFSHWKASSTILLAVRDRPLLFLRRGLGSY